MAGHHDGERLTVIGENRPDVNCLGPARVERPEPIGNRFRCARCLGIVTSFRQPAGKHSFETQPGFSGTPLSATHTPSRHDTTAGNRDVKIRSSVVGGGVLDARQGQQPSDIKLRKSGEAPQHRE